MFPVVPLSISTMMFTVAEPLGAMLPRSQWMVSTRSKAQPVPWLGVAEIKVTPDVAERLPNGYSATSKGRYC